MPRGYYLGQGLIPLGTSSSDDEEGPCTLPNGRVVCGPHGLVVCGKCCSDYSFMEEDGEGFDDDDDDDDDGEFDKYDNVYGPRIMKFDGGFDIRKGSGQNFPGIFVPPSPTITPERLFRNLRAFMMIKRYTLPNDTGVGLIYTDGACLSNGQANPKAGWAFWHGVNVLGKKLVCSARLEKKGPFGDEGAQTSNRAELRAVIAALRFRVWNGEGFHTMVFATDSEYVVKGATEWARGWVRNGWMTRNGAPVKNRDLWEALLGEVDRYKLNEMDIKFWHIPREWNTVADQGAKEGAAQDNAPGLWRDIEGINVM